MKVKVLYPFYDIEAKIKRQPNEEFNASKKRIEAIQKVEEEKTIKLIEVLDAETPKASKKTVKKTAKGEKDED